MRNVKINKFFFVFLIFLSCEKNNLRQNKEATNYKQSFTNFYEKIDSTTINKKQVFIEKFYTKDDLKYIVNYNNEKKIIPYRFGKSQPSSFSVKKKDDKSFIITFGQGNATLVNYYFNIDLNNNLILSKIKSIYSYSIKDSIIQDSLMVNNKINSLNENNLKQIINFINKN